MVQDEVSLVAISDAAVVDAYLDRAGEGGRGLNVVVRGRCAQDEPGGRLRPDLAGVEGGFACCACWRGPPTLVAFGRPEGSGDGAERRLLLLGWLGDVAGGPRKMTELPEVHSTARYRIWFDRALAAKAEVGTAVYGVPGRGKDTGG